MELLAAADADFPHSTVNLRAKGLQREFTVITSLNWLLDSGCSIGIKAREKQRRLHLSAGHRQSVVNRLQTPSGHAQRRTSAIGSFDFRAHHFERLNDPCHRTAGERLVST